MTITNYIEDLEDVIEWSKKQSWFVENYIITGHSIGGLTVLDYASRNSSELKGVIPIGATISGKLWTQSLDTEYLKTWKQKGYFDKVSKSLPGKKGKIGYGLVEDSLKYDAIDMANNINAPVFLIAGENESKSNSTEIQQMLLDKLPDGRELHIIPNMPHVPQNDTQLDEIEKAVIGCLANL